MSRDARVRAIRASPYFDADWYVARHGDVTRLGMDPAEHFLRIGTVLARSPGPRFSARRYLEAYPEVAASGANALLDYIERGAAAGRAVFEHDDAAYLGGAGGRSGPVTPAATPEGLAVVHRPGALAFHEDRKTVLVAAHLAGRTLFGGERSFLTVLEALGALGFDVVVAMPPPATEDYGSAVRARAAAVYELRLPLRNVHAALDEGVLAELATIIGRHDVRAVHVNTITLREPLVAARRAGVPGVVHAREIVTKDPDLAAWMGGPAATIVDAVLADADYVIANSRATALCFPTLGRTSVVPNTVDATALCALPRPTGDGPTRVALVANTLVKKGLVDAIDLARLLEGRVDFELVVVGPHSPLTARLRGPLADRPLPARITFTGYVEAPHEAMAQADVVVSLSQVEESFGRTVLEAMFAARPVVAYAAGALPELVRDGETGFLVPRGDLPAFARCVERLCRDPELRARMGDAGRRVAQRDFSFEVVVDALASAYRPILPPASAVAAAERDLVVSLPCRNQSPFADPFFVKNRARFAHCTGVRLVGDGRLVCASLIGRQMHLVRFDLEAKTSDIVETVPTRDGERDVSVDLLDFDGEGRIVTSNCERRSFSLYRVDGDGLTFDRAVVLDDPDAGYCHGVSFVPGHPDVVCATTITGARRVYFVSLTTGASIFAFDVDGFLPKDARPVGPGLWVIASMRDYIDTSPGSVNVSKLSLVRVDARFEQHVVLHELYFEDAQLDGTAYANGMLYAANQAQDVVLVVAVERERLVLRDVMEGFSFPHGVDISSDGDLLAVTNYGPNTVSLRTLKT